MSLVWQSSHASSDCKTMGAHAYFGEPIERHHAQRSSIERKGIVCALFCTEDGVWLLFRRTHEETDGQIDR